MEAAKTIQTVWNHRGDLLDSMRLAVIDSYKNNTPLDDVFSDMIEFDVVETEKHIKLIIKFI